MTTATLSGGVGTFINLADDLAETISIELKAGNLSTTTNSITVTAAAATKLFVSTPPPSSITAGQSFSVTVQALDPFNNVDTGYSGAVTVALPGDPSFTTTVQADKGVASFTGLTAPLSASGVAIQVTATGLPSTATNPLNVTQVTHSTPPAAPTIILETIATTQKHNKKGKPVGKPVFGGFTLQYSGAMNSATAGLAANYQVFSETVKKVKKTKVTTWKPVSFSVSYTPATDSVLLGLKSTTPFAKGGKITISGVTSQAGVALSLSDDVLLISPKAKGITIA